MSSQPIPIFYTPYQDPNSNLIQYDENGNPIQNSYGQTPGSFGYVPQSSIVAPTGNSPSSNSTVYGSPVAAPQFDAANGGWNITNETSDNQAYINAGGQEIDQEAEAQLPYYSGLQTQFENEANAGLNQLAATPGYTPAQAGQINVDYSQYNTSPSTLAENFLTPTQQTDIMGSPQVGSQVTDQGIANEGDQLNAYETDLSGQLGNYANYTAAGTTQLDTGLTTADQQLQSGLSGAQSGFSSLNSAVDNPALGFDPNNTEQQITPTEMAQMETNAGEAVGAQYQTAEDQLQQQAANSGNSSPLAIAAANARLQQQQAAGEGAAESNAAIAALQAQEQQAASIEQQREAATDTQAGLEAQAATTEQSQAQNAAALAGETNVSSAGLAGTQEIAAGENVGQQGINVANQYGTTALGQQNTETGQQYTADTTAEQLAQSRANELALNEQATQEGNEQTQYGQGVGSAQATAAGATNVGQAQIAGQNTYLQGVQNEQANAQQGGQTAVGEQQNAYGTQTSGLNQSTGIEAGYKTNSPTVLGDVLSGISTVAGAAGNLAKTAPSGGGSSGGGGSATGDVFTKPTYRKVGEKGPELIVPVGRYRQKDRRAV